MKRTFAIIIVVLLALGMVGMFFPAFLANNQAPAVQTPTQTAPEPAPANQAPTLKL